MLPGLRDVLVRFEEAADVKCLAAPEVAVDGPVEGEFEGALVEGAEGQKAVLAGVVARRGVPLGARKGARTGRAIGRP